MKHFLSALALGCLLLSCNRDLENNENNETPAPPKEERLVLASLYEFGSNVRFQYKNGNEINRMAMDGPHGEASMDFEYDTYGRIVKERRFHHRSDYGETIITYQYDNQSRLTSSHAISTQYYPDTGYTPRCSVEKKHTYTYQGNKVTVKIEMGADTCSAIPETGKEKTITLFVENGKVVKSLDENNQIIETIEYLNPKNTLRNMKGFPALVVEFYIRPFTYELPFYNGIEHIEDLRFIDNIKTRDFHNGSYWEYRYSYDKRKSHDNDYLEIEEVNIYEKSHNDPTHDNYLSSASPARFYTKEK
jgi:lipoprotein